MFIKDEMGCFSSLIKKEEPYSHLFWSDRRGSNPRPLAWEAKALPTELLSHRFFLLSLCKDTKK